MNSDAAETLAEAIHGLVYPSSFLESLRKVPIPDSHPHFVSAPTSPRPDAPVSDSTDAGIPLLPPAALAQLHVAHLTAHAPDHVLFPFLHGVEGENIAQNTFFYGAKGAELAVPVPRYRGLMYVICDEDLDSDLDSEEEDEEDVTDGESDIDIDGDSGMELDVEVDEVLVHEGEEDMVIESHMHPLIMKPPPPLLPPPPTYANPEHRPPRIAPPLLTSTFTPGELLRRGQGEGGWEFVPLKVPDGISLRNFGIQVPIMATVSDIVVYSPRGPDSTSARRLAARFRDAIARKRRDREARLGDSKTLLDYNVFLLDAGEEELRDETSPLKHVVKGAGNTVNFAEREKEEMRALTRASELMRLYPQGYEPGASGAKTPLYGQIILGNSTDVPMSGEGNPGGYDLCIECHDLAPYPSSAHLRAAEEKLSSMEAVWLDEDASTLKNSTMRPPPDANDVIHLPFPSSPPNTGHIRPLVGFLEHWITPVPVAVADSGKPSETVPEEKQKEKGRTKERGGRHWTLLSSAPSFPPLFGSSAATAGSTIGAASPRIRSFTSPTPPPRNELIRPVVEGLLPPSRPLKVLIYSADGYTESSVLALCLLMALKGLTLPEAYLELQCEVGGIEGDGRGGPGRSFFVYAGDLGVLRRWESEERGKRDRKGRSTGAPPMHESSGAHTRGESMSGMGVGVNPYVAGWGVRDGVSLNVPDGGVVERGPLSAGVLSAPVAIRRSVGRPRAATLPTSLGWDHQAWFEDPRFDGSFPSRVLDYLYLGNLNHASNVYMLHALGITHVVSVGECALVPPGPISGATCAPQDSSAGLSTHYVAAPAPAPSVTTNGHGHGRRPRRGSLWAEERAGRIKVLDIQGVCDDGIDTLEPQLAPICDWMDSARESTPHAKILVHCRVGVSRSATVVIAYMMRALGISLVEAYLVVRSRRLSVLIQPNMRLLWNLCGWEVKLARERAESSGDMGFALKGAVAWPWLAREVHGLNEKYLH